MLYVIQSEHRSNFRALEKHYSILEKACDKTKPNDANAAYLLLFYSVEAGLKYLLNKRLKVPYRFEVRRAKLDVEQFGHDIPRIIAHLKIPAGKVLAPPSNLYCVNGYNDKHGGQKFGFSAAHEALRYGLTIEAAAQSSIVSYLSSISAYLNAEVPS